MFAREANSPVEGDDIGGRRCACLSDAGVGRRRGDQIGWGAVEDVAERRNHLERHPFRALVDQAVDLWTRERDVAFGEQRDEIGRVVQAPGSHQLGESPGVVDFAFHDVAPSGLRSISCFTVRFNASRRVERRNSSETN